MTIKIKAFSVIRCRRQPIFWKHWITICTAVCVAAVQSYRIQRPMCSSMISLLHKIDYGHNLDAVHEFIIRPLWRHRQHLHRYQFRLHRMCPPGTISTRTNRIEGHRAHRIPMNYVPMRIFSGMCSLFEVSADLKSIRIFILVFHFCLSVGRRAMY